MSLNRVVALKFSLLPGRGVRYVTFSASSVCANACQNETLQYLSFFVQPLGKNFKMMTVMVWGLAVGGKSHKVVDWCVAAAIMVTGFAKCLWSRVGQDVPRARRAYLGLSRGALHGVQHFEVFPDDLRQLGFLPCARHDFDPWWFHRRLCIQCQFGIPDG